jgi:hypothetical protein
MPSKSPLLDRIAVTVKEAVILIGTNDNKFEELCTLGSFRQRSSKTHTASVLLTCGGGSMEKKEPCDAEGVLASRVAKLAFRHDLQKTPLVAVR